MATSDSPQSGIYTDQHLLRDTTMHVDVSNVLNIDGSLNMASGKVTLPGSLGIGYINIGSNLFGGRNAASNETIASGTSAPTAFWGGLLMPDGQPAMKFVSSADKVFMLQWASAVVAAVALLPVSLPNDMSTAGGLTIEFFGETYGTGSATDAVDALNITPHFGIGGSTALGTTAPDFTSTPSWKGITVASGSVTTNDVSITVWPGAHALRGIQVYGGRISYTKKTS